MDISQKQVYELDKHFYRDLKALRRKFDVLPPVLVLSPFTLAMRQYLITHGLCHLLYCPVIEKELYWHIEHLCQQSVGAQALLENKKKSPAKPASPKHKWSLSLACNLSH